MRTKHIGYFPRYSANFAIVVLLISSFFLWMASGISLVENFALKDFKKVSEVDALQTRREITGKVLSAVSEQSTDDKLSSPSPFATSMNGLEPSLSLESEDTQQLQTLTEEVAISEDSLNNAVNNFRGENGLNTIDAAADICAFAKQRLSELHVDYSHNGFDGVVAKLNRGSAAENISSTSNNRGNNYVVEQMWAISEGHRKNMLESWTEGCGYYDGQFAVFLFAK